MHVSAHGMYGLTILSGTDYRQIVNFALKYQELAAPVADTEFKERGGHGIWTFAPLPNARAEARLYKFIVEMQFGIATSLHRDVMGPAFGAREFRFVFGPPEDAAR